MICLPYSADKYLFKVKSRNSMSICWLWSKSTIKASERCHAVFIFNIELVQQINLIFMIKSIIIHEYQYFLIEKKKNTHTQVNTNQYEFDTSQHEPDTSQHESTRVRHESTRARHESTRARHESTRINTSPTRITTSPTLINTTQDESTRVS